MSTNTVNFVAEISANHLGSKDRAIALVKAAARSGATSVKVQTYTAETMTLDIQEEDFKVSGNHPLWGGRTLFSLYQEAHTPWEWHEELFQLSRTLGLVPFSSPFDLTALKLLEELNAPLYKIASLETSDLNLISAVAATGKPLIVSTGATEFEEIRLVVETVEKIGNRDLTLLVCTSSYPADPKDANISRMAMLRNEFGVKVGLSDHTLGIGTSIAAIALGAQVIERHLTLLRSDGGADSAFSLEPKEFETLVVEGKNAAESIGNPEWKLAPSESESRRLRRSLYVCENVSAGESITIQNVRAIRPGYGLSASELSLVLGKKFIKDYTIGTPLSRQMFQ